MPTNNSTNGKGTKPTATTGEGFDSYSSLPMSASQSTQFNLSADATIGSLLDASDDQYAAFINRLRQVRQNKINNRAREVANILNPYLQQEEIMVEAQRIVDTETAGLPSVGHTLPSFRLMGGQ